MSCTRDVGRVDRHPRRLPQRPLGAAERGAGQRQELFDPRRGRRLESLDREHLVDQAEPPRLCSADGLRPSRACPSPPEGRSGGEEDGRRRSEDAELDLGLAEGRRSRTRRRDRTRAPPRARRRAPRPAPRRRPVAAHSSNATNRSASAAIIEGSRSPRCSPTSTPAENVLPDGVEPDDAHRVVRRDAAQRRGQLAHHRGRQDVDGRAIERDSCEAFDRVSVRIRVVMDGTRVRSSTPRSSRAR